MQNYLNLSYIDNRYFYTNNLIIFFSSYGFFSMIKVIFIILQKKYSDKTNKNTQVSEIETIDRNVILKKRKLI